MESKLKTNKKSSKLKKGKTIWERGNLKEKGYVNNYFRNYPQGNDSKDKNKAESIMNITINTHHSSKKLKRYKTSMEEEYIDMSPKDLLEKIINNSKKISNLNININYNNIQNVQTSPQMNQSNLTNPEKE
jgi:hypothetical protein